jgi:hypothetical protein
MPPDALEVRDDAPSHQRLGRALVIGGAVLALAGLGVCVAAIRGAFGPPPHPTITRPNASAPVTPSNE